ncbi:MAG: hypothetical protein DWH99_13430 [Planctomycetota bacterium]|nr:MAG: hypothetical protein DWH99_13430 [Planctomycetota bacterium]
MPLGKQITRLAHALLGSHLLAHLSRLHQQCSARRIRYPLELAHAQKHLFKVGVLRRESLLLFLQFLNRTVGFLALYRLDAQATQGDQSQQGGTLSDST